MIDLRIPCILKIFFTTSIIAATIATSESNAQITDATLSDGSSAAAASDANTSGSTDCINYIDTSELSTGSSNSQAATTQTRSCPTTIIEPNSKSSVVYQAPGIVVDVPAGSTTYITYDQNGDVTSVRTTGSNGGSSYSSYISIGGGGQSSYVSSSNGYTSYNAETAKQAAAYANKIVQNVFSSFG